VLKLAMTKTPERKHKALDGFSIETLAVRYWGVTDMIVPFSRVTSRCWAVDDAHIGHANHRPTFELSQ
jgi:hypothetical protein